MVQFNKNLGNFNFQNTALSAKTNATQTKKLDFKPTKNAADYPSAQDGYGKLKKGDTIGGKVVESVEYFMVAPGVKLMRVLFTDGSQDTAIGG